MIVFTSLILFTAGMAKKCNFKMMNRKLNQIECT